jgi:predicted glutamine amidotransferase
VIALENCHPFVRECWGQNWVFAHNGDLKEFAPNLTGRFLPIGSTDSELAFCYLMQSLQAQFVEHAPSVVEVSAFLLELCREIATHGTFNMMLSNGDALFVHCSTKLHYIERQHPFATASLSDDDVAVDFSEVTTPQDRVAVIVTEPLTTNETWTQFLPGEMKVFVGGKVSTL